MTSTASTRTPFQDYTTTLIQEALHHKDTQDIEIETVFPKWAPHIVLIDCMKNEQCKSPLYIDCGTPLMEDIPGTTDKRLIPQPSDGVLPDTHQEWAKGIRIYVHTTMKHQSFLPYLRDINKPVSRHVPKVFTAVRNTNNNGEPVYHLFPNVAQNTDKIREMCEVYRELGKSSEEEVPNYILRAVRRYNDPQHATPNDYEEVIDSLVQKSRDLERRLEDDRLLMHTFGAAEFKRVYQRFKYLASQPDSGVTAWKGATMTVDVADKRSADSEVEDDGEHNSDITAPSTIRTSTTPPSSHTTTRLTLHGQATFDRYCQQFKSLRSPDEHASFIASCSDAECELMQKSEMSAKELPALSLETYPAKRRCYNGFKINAKRETVMNKASSTKALRAFFDPSVKHSYRFKQRYSFLCHGFRVDLTRVRHSDDDHRTFKPTPFIALHKLQHASHTETYELEMERVNVVGDGTSDKSDKSNKSDKSDKSDKSNQSSKSVGGTGKASAAQYAKTLLRLMDECLHAIHYHTQYFGQHVDLNHYPLLMDDVALVQPVNQAFNHKPCHPMRRNDFPLGSLRIKTNVSPNVSNMTHGTYDYVCHHWNDYVMLVKTDGLHCLGFVHASAKTLYLYTNKALTWMAFPLSVCPDEDYVLDGEFYFKGAEETGVCSFFVFDVYAKGDTSLLTLPLHQRLDTLSMDTLRVKAPSLVVHKKQPLSIQQYQQFTQMETPPADVRMQLERFECRDANGAKPQDDGFILMHTGPLVRTDITTDEDEAALVETTGAKPYIMYEQAFLRKGQGLQDESQRDSAYVVCLKWKPEDECTIDFQLQFVSDVYDPVTEGDTRRVQLCSKYNDRSNVNLFTVLSTMATGVERNKTPMVPRKTTNRHTIYPFQPAEAYDYELGDAPVGGGVVLKCDPKTGHVYTLAGEIIPTKASTNTIVEMRYDPRSKEWTPTRLRTDKQQPNAYNVALDNWRNIFHPVPPPRSWTPSDVTLYDTTTLYAYYGNRQDKNNFVDSIHLLLKQYLLFRAAKLYAEEDPRKPLTVFEMGCGKGTDLFHWNYIHEHIRAIQFYLGTDYDVHGLHRKGGAIERYLQGTHRENTAYTLETKYPFDALFAQADSGAAWSTCATQPWSARSATSATTRPVSQHKLHYQLLRHVLYGIAPEEPGLAEVLLPRYVHPTYSLISCQMAMHHFSGPQSALWDNLDTVLAADGLFVATVPNGDFIRDKIQGSADQAYRVRVRVRTNERPPRNRGGNRNRQRHHSPPHSPRYTYSEQEWYVYEHATPPGASDSSTTTHVRFHTPKINPSIEPLFFRQQLNHARIQKRFDVLYMDTFGAFADAHQLSIYDTVCTPFHTASIDPDTLQHNTQDGQARNVMSLEDETEEAREYSREGHYVIVLGKRGGRSKGEMGRVRKGLGGE